MSRKCAIPSAAGATNARKSDGFIHGGIARMATVVMSSSAREGVWACLLGSLFAFIVAFEVEGAVLLLSCTWSTKLRSR